MHPIPHSIASILKAKYTSIKFMTLLRGKTDSLALVKIPAHHDGKVTIIAPGWTCKIEQFGRLIEGLESKGNAVIVRPNRGFWGNKLDCGSGEYLGLCAKDILPALDSIPKIDEVNILGHSQGGQIALRLACLLKDKHVSVGRVLLETPALGDVGRPAAGNFSHKLHAWFIRSIEWLESRFGFNKFLKAYYKTMIAATKYLDGLAVGLSKNGLKRQDGLPSRAKSHMMFWKDAGSQDVLAQITAIKSMRAGAQFVREALERLSREGVRISVVSTAHDTFVEDARKFCPPSVEYRKIDGAHFPHMDDPDFISSAVSYLSG